MTKVYPNVGALELAGEFNRLPAMAETSLTVWRKSLLFNCNGFTVFDCKGNLVFRVDNYSSTSAREVLLMDAAGKPLLTIRRKVLVWLSSHQQLSYIYFGISLSMNI